MKVNMGQPNDLLIDDLELLLREIDEYNSATVNNKLVDVPHALENYLQFVAKSGNTVFPWPHVRALFRTKMMSAIQQFQEPGCPSEGFILERFDMFRIAAPFTIQRLAELILQPTRHYRKKEKFLRGLEKTVLVVSTIEPRSLTGEDEKNGNDDVNNTSTSSCEGEPENIVFNRTFSMDRQDMVTVRSSPIDVLGQNIPIVSEDIVLDPVTTSAVSVAVDIINHSIGVAPDVIIEDSVTTSSGLSMDVITPDIAITVPSDLSLVAIPEDSTGAIHLPQSLEAAMECESSTTPIEVSPVTLLQCVADQDPDMENLCSPSNARLLGEVSNVCQDLVSAAITHASSETSPVSPQADDNISVLEDVSSSLVNMDAVKLPLEDNTNVSVDCHSSVATAPEETTAATNLLHSVTQISEDSAIVAPLEATISADDV